MKERPILFSAPMVRAILAGTKTQTRRVVKPQPIPVQPQGAGIVSALYRQGDYQWPDKVAGCSTISCKPNGPDGWAHENSPYGQPGDRLWVRETWQHSNFPLGPYDESCTVFYRADYMDDAHGPDGEKSPEGRYRNWVPSIHMFRSASRILLEITAVRVERLQDISDNDIEAEGTAQWVKDGGKVMRPRPGFDGWWPDENGNFYVKPNRVAFCSLWESVNGLCAWDKNPWVWVIEFKRVEGGAS